MALGVYDGAAGTDEYEEEGSEQFGEKTAPLELRIVEFLDARILERE
jgi:hypothetical protein